MPNAKDETGNRYGKLTVVSLAYINDHRERYWNCKCDCGKETCVRGSALRSGKAQSCGCLKHTSRSKDETGNRYGNLVVIEKAQEKIGKHAAWKCKCDCGNIITVKGSSLRDGTKKRCPECSRRNSITDETGNIYGDLTVIGPDGQDQYRKALWKCRCCCGKEISVAGTVLRQYKKLNCGCKTSRSSGEEHIKKLLDENHIKYEREKTFDSCRFPDTQALARFDFYLPDFNRVIEYDGQQHYFTSKREWDTIEALNKTQQRDSFKDKWCAENNITIVRIPFFQKNVSIDDLLR